MYFNRLLVSHNPQNQTLKSLKSDFYEQKYETF